MIFLKYFKQKISKLIVDKLNERNVNPENYESSFKEIIKELKINKI
jgi:hypothetical protein